MNKILEIVPILVRKFESLDYFCPRRKVPGADSAGRLINKTTHYKKGNMPSDRICISVILPLKLEWEPCYWVSGKDSEDGVAPGDRVKVTFAGKNYTAVVSGAGIKPEVDESKIKEVLSVERSLESVSSQEIALWRQVATYYMCTVGEVYKAAYPLQKISSEEVLARRAEKIEKRKKTVMEAAIRKLMVLKQRQEKAIGTLDTRAGTLRERIEKKLSSLETARKESVKARLQAEYEKLREEEACLKARIMQARAELDIISDRISALEHQENQGSDMNSDGTGENHPMPKETGTGIILTEAQEKAADSIRKAFGNHKTALLEGVTGSGKTEIYITLASETLSGGKNVLYLVPEIAIGKQLELRLGRIFGDRLLTFHSGETAARRAEVAARIRKGNYIVLGTRSALFLPHNDLGLIIVDEEHDSSYKQDSPAPRYNGRDTAIMLGAIHSCPVLLGSATPSLESLYNCKAGKFSLIRLTARYHGAPDADVELIDTLAERKKKGMRGNLSLKLIFKIADTLERGGQVIVLRSRRSYSPVLQCQACGYMPKCLHCNLPLSYHKAADKDICHYCGYSVKHTGICPKCGGTLSGLGSGTQKIEEEIAMQFPQARIARLDSDSAQDRKYESEVIRSFSEGRTDILIGTQMVTKGFDFSRLSLVAVIGADSMLAQQDFRADEKALQTLEQFMGRCGRREHRGTFVIQTCQPGHPVYQQLIHPKEDAAGELMEERRIFGYPPYCRIVDIIVKDSFEDRADRMAMKICRRLSDKGIRYTGPFAPFSGKDAGRHVRTVRASLEKDRNLQNRKALLYRLVLDFEKTENYSGHIALDVDPA